MKKTIYIISVLILFQSCYAYKNFDIKNYETLQYNDIKIKLKDSTLLKGTVMDYSKEKLTIKNGKKVNEIAFSNIKSI